MKKEFELWCYGGKSKAFFIEQNEAIHKYNSKMMDRLLAVMTIILGTYLAVSTGTGVFSKYFSAYLVCFIALLLMFFSFKLKARKSILLTRIYICLFSAVMFAFVCILGTVFEPNTRATLFIVYVLVLPMLFIIPTHYMYGFLILATVVFSVAALRIKDLSFAQMDIVHSVTCLVIGIFICRHILESRMALYATNRHLDRRNIQLENLTRNIPGGVCQCKNDQALTLLSASDGFLSMFGYTQNEITELFRGSFLEMIYPDDRRFVLETISSLVQSGQTMEAEHRVLCKNGEPVWILGKGRLLPDGNGGMCLYGMFVEITDRKREQEELRLRLEQHQIIMNQTTDILFEWDIRNDTLNFSANWHKKFGYDPIDNEISGRIPLSKNIHPEDMPAFVKIMKDTADGEPYSETEFRIKDINERYSWCRIRATAQFDSEGRAIKAVGVILDINAEKKEKQNLLKMAQRDALTGIYNKTVTNAVVSHRMKDFDFTVLQALLIIDVDYFKSVNDTYGHMAGDNILCAVAEQLRNHIRSGDVVGRIGGDEFLMYFSEVESEDAALLKAQTIHAALGLLTPEPGASPVTCSIGMAVFPHGTVEYSDLYRYADTALYLRKDEGRNGVTVYNGRANTSELLQGE